MVKSRKINNIFQKIINKSKLFSKKLNKTNKTNKKAFKKCEDFCKNDYMVEMNKLYKKGINKYSPTKQENEYAYNTCKKTFCNENCDGYDFFGDKQKQIDFKKKIKNGFQDTYSTNKINMLKKRGALSGCVDIVDYNP